VTRSEVGLELDEIRGRFLSHNLPIEWISGEGGSVVRMVDGRVGPRRGARR